MWSSDWWSKLSISYWRCSDFAKVTFNSLAKIDIINVRGDKTQVGHVLGSPEKRSMLPEPERSLSPSGCALLRLLLHAVLVWSSSNADDVSLYKNQIYILYCISNTF